MGTVPSLGGLSPSPPQPFGKTGHSPYHYGTTTARIPSVIPGRGGESICGAKDWAKVSVQGVNPDVLEGSSLPVLLFQFTPSPSRSEPDPTGRPVGSAGKGRDFHERFQSYWPAGWERRVRHAGTPPILQRRTHGVPTVYLPWASRCPREIYHRYAVGTPLMCRGDRRLGRRYASLDFHGNGKG